MSGPLLAVDGPSLLFRAFFALPKSITDDEGRPVNALLGTANLILQAHERFSPRAIVLCWGAEAAEYRVEAYEAYHADRPEVPDELQHQFDDVVPFFEAFGIDSLVTEDLEADDLLGALARAEEAAGGTAILFTGDRDMFQCVNERTVVLFPGAKGGPEVIDAGGVRERYGIEPEQVPDFIALRGDPSDGLPGAKGIGAKTAAQLLAEHGTLDALLELPLGLTPRQRGTLETQADELRTFREIATLQPADVALPPDRPLDAAAAAVAAHERGMHRLAERLEKMAA